MIELSSLPLLYSYKLEVHDLPREQGNDELDWQSLEKMRLNLGNANEVRSNSDLVTEYGYMIGPATAE